MDSRLSNHRARPKRGRPNGPTDIDRRRVAAPTRARLLALRVLERVQRAGAYADLSLHAALGRSDLNAPDRAFATDLVYGTLRWRGRIDFYLSRCVHRDLDKLEPLVATALRLGAFQILMTDRVPVSAAVDESVRCIRAARADRAAGLVNAVLRRLAAEHESVELPTLEDEPHAHLTHALSLPSWLAERWLELYGPAEAALLARASNDPPPLTVRANTQRVSAAELLEEVRGRFPEAAACQFARNGIVLGRRGNPALDPAFLAGRFSVQDEASQLVIGLLDPQPGEQILDVCAAPGGKSTAIAERVGPTGTTFAIDRHPRRLDLLRRAARRLGLTKIRCTLRDATRPIEDLELSGKIDRVLVDAPCTGLGTLRRNPDARWRVRPGDPARIAETQLAILKTAAAPLRPGGVLVYSACTVLPEENEEIVSAFLEASKDFEIAETSDVPPEVRKVVGSDGFLRCYPHLHDADGFFAARFVRRK